MRDGLTRDLDGVGVVPEVALAELDQRVRLVHVLFADLGGGHMTSMLGVIEAGDLGLRIGDAPQGEQLDGERSREQQQHACERGQ